MSWTETARPKYCRDGLRYASDMTDAEWRLIEPMLPGPSRVGRPRKTLMRVVVDAIFYIASTGCQWRLLPRDFPPFSTVQGYFYAWSQSGHTEKMLGFFRAKSEFYPELGRFLRQRVVERFPLLADENEEDDQ